MRNNHKIMYLFADYVTRVVAARYVRILSELSPIRDRQTAGDAKIVITRQFHIKYSTNIFKLLRDANYVISDAQQWQLWDKSGVFTLETQFVIVGASMEEKEYGKLQYAHDMRELLNRAIDPNKYW